MEQLKIIKITLFTLLFLLSCGGEIIESQWLAESIVIDGDAAEWENIPLYFNENLNVVYGIANDKTHIHFMIRFNDQQVARMFSARGFTLRFNENDEKNRGG